MATTDNNDKDLLGFSRDKLDLSNPAQYLKVDDFLTQPETNNADYYPNAHDGVQIGTSAAVGRYAGHPLFSGSGSLPPYALVDARARAFQHAAMAEQMRKEYQRQQNIDVTYNRPDNLPLAYNEDYQQVGKNAALQIYGDAVKYYGGNQRKAADDIGNPNGLFGKKYSDFNQNYHTYGSNVDEMNKMTQDVRKQQVENKIVVPDSMEKTLSDFESGGFGKLNEHDPNDLKQKFIQMKVMNNMLPAYNAFVKELTPKEVPEQSVGRFKGKSGYSTTAIDPEVAKQEALKVISGGQKTAWALTLGLPPDATTDQIATALGESAVNKRDVQYKPLPQHDGTEGEKDYANQKPGEFNVPVNFVSGGVPSTQVMKYHRSFNTKKPINVTNTEDVFDLTTGGPLRNAPTTFLVEPSGTVVFGINRAGGKKEDILGMMGTMHDYTPKDYETAKLDAWRKNYDAEYGKGRSAYAALDESDSTAVKVLPTEDQIQSELERSGKLTKDKTVVIPLSHVKGALEQQKINTGVDEKATEELLNKKPKQQNVSSKQQSALEAFKKQIGREPSATEYEKILAKYK